ncbi:MAG: hypothetical protein ACKVWR_16575 [Acidimicrobiales bacterium]
MAIFAHQGGWDEILLVAAPLLVIGLLLALANRRAKQQHAAGLDAAPHPAPGGASGRTADGSPPKGA